MPSKGIVYVAWGDKVQDELQRSIDSLPDGIPHTVIEPETHDSGHSAKLCMFEESPYDLTLYLDTDTVVLTDNLDFVFEMAWLYNIAIALAPASDAAHQYGFVGEDYLPQYNTGVMCFNKSDRTREVFEWWRENQVGKYDQPAFARAVWHHTVNPYVLPREWNFRSMPLEVQGFGPIKIWHSRTDPPKQKLKGFWRLSNAKNPS